MGARVSAVAVRGVLIGRNGRSAVGSTRTAGIVRAALRPRQGARPRRFDGPGPRCGLGGSARESGKPGFELSWAEPAFAGFWAQR